MKARALARCTGAIAMHPSLWLTAFHQLRVSLPRRWWSRPPFLPVPPAAYMRFRVQTQYGSADHRIEAADVLNYLSWCKLHRSLAS